MAKKPEYSAFVGVLLIFYGLLLWLGTMIWRSISG
jgi:hypothetical protein